MRVARVHGELPAAASPVQPRRSPGGRPACSTRDRDQEHHDEAEKKKRSLRRSVSTCLRWIRWGRFRRSQSWPRGRHGGRGAMPTRFPAVENEGCSTMAEARRSRAPDPWPRRAHGLAQHGAAQQRHEGWGDVANRVAASAPQTPSQRAPPPPPPPPPPMSSAGAATLERAGRGERGRGASNHASRTA